MYVCNNSTVAQNYSIYFYFDQQRPMNCVIRNYGDYEVFKNGDHILNVMITSLSSTKY